MSMPGTYRRTSMAAATHQRPAPADQLRAGTPPRSSAGRQVVGIEQDQIGPGADRDAASVGLAEERRPAWCWRRGPRRPRRRRRGDHVPTAWSMVRDDPARVPSASRGAPSTTEMLERAHRRSPPCHRVGHQRHARRCLGPEGDAQERGVHVHEVGDETGDDPIVGQADTGDARGAVVQRTHAVEQVGDHARAGVDGRLGAGGVGRRVAQAHDHARDRRQRDGVGHPGLLGADGHEPDRCGQAGQPLEVDGQDQVGPVGARSSAEERPLEMGAEHRGAAAVRGPRRPRSRRGAGRSASAAVTPASGSHAVTPVGRRSSSSRSQSAPEREAQSTSSTPFTWRSTKPGSEATVRRRPDVGDDVDDPAVVGPAPTPGDLAVRRRDDVGTEDLLGRDGHGGRRYRSLARRTACDRGTGTLPPVAVHDAGRDAGSTREAILDAARTAFAERGLRRRVDRRHRQRRRHRQGQPPPPLLQQGRALHRGVRTPPRRVVRPGRGGGRRRLGGLDPVRPRASAGFEFFAENPDLVRLVRREALDGSHFGVDLGATLRPMFEQAVGYLETQMKEGTFRQHDPEQMVISGLGAVLSYFSDLPFIEGLLGADPLGGRAARTAPEPHPRVLPGRAGTLSRSDYGLPPCPRSPRPTPRPSSHPTACPWPGERVVDTVDRGRRCRRASSAIPSS